MTFAIALALLAEVATGCAPRDDARLGGGAKLVRPVGEAQGIPLLFLGPTTDIRTRPTTIQQTSVPAAEIDSSGEDATAPCQAKSYTIA